MTGVLMVELVRPTRLYSRGNVDVSIRTRRNGRGAVGFVALRRGRWANKGRTI